MLRLPIENTLDREEKIMAEWITTTLEECTDILGDGLHGTPKYTENGEYAFVNGNNLVDGEILIKKETKRVDYSQYDKYKKPLTNRTILVSINGTLGNVGVYGSEKIILGKSACYFNVKKSVDKDFIYYIVSSPTFKQYLESNATGTTIKNISLKQMREYTFELPEIGEQKRISSVLRKIDEKIKNNRAINNNLEQQAQAIFANEFLSLDTLPEGWKQASLIDIADYLNGLAMQKYRPTADETGIPVLKIKELRQGCCDDNSELCSPSIKSEYIIRDGDVIFSWSGSLLVDFWCGGICGLNQHLFKVTSNKYNKWFYYAWTKHHLDRFIAVAVDKATTMGHIKRDELSKAEVLIPNEADYKRIETLLQPIYDLIIANRIENKKLAETRDFLLPRLISGELDVSDIDL